MRRTARAWWLVAILTPMASGCGSEPHVRAVATDERPVLQVVDSILPIEEEIRRFRETLGPPRDGLSRGGESRDALVDRFVRALTAVDTTGLVSLLMTRDEFGWLYYPTSRFTAAPYELPPGLVWFQIESASSRGLARLLDRLGGTELTVAGYACDPQPRAEGRNRLWGGCTVRIDPPSGDPYALTLFGSILERDGAFKFVSYGNGF